MQCGVTGCMAKCYSQLPDVDYHETFSPTARMTSIRTVMQIAVDYSLTIHQIDVNAAYLNALSTVKSMLSSLTVSMSMAKMENI